MTIKEITLLSVEECRQCQVVIPSVGNCNCWWWLRSPSYIHDFAARVSYGDNVSLSSYPVNSDNVAVRPALKLNLDPSDSMFWYKPEKLVGTKIKFGNYWWTILDSELGELYVLCDTFIAKRCFDLKSNEWDKSELKRWLETEGIKLITS